MVRRPFLCLAVLLAVLPALAVAATARAALPNATLTAIPLSLDKYSIDRGNSSAQLVVELTIDLACAFTKLAWPVLTQVVALYEDRVLFRFRDMPLPYHQQSFILAKALQVVLYNAPAAKRTAAAFTFMDTCITNQAAIYNWNTANMSADEVRVLVGTWATNGTGVNTTAYNNSMTRDTVVGETLEMRTRNVFKYCTSVLGAFATPTVWINGVPVFSGLATLAEWQSTLDGLLAGPGQC